MLEETFIVV